MQDLTEIRDRTRRIETRLTKFMTEMGVAAGNEPPHFLTGQPRSGAGCTISVPTPHASLREILAAIPDSHVGVPVDIYLGIERLAIVTKRPPLDVLDKAD